eukprot:scaffold655265_cov45-Prasinocladus_malaysianus.AAC.1
MIDNKKGRPWARALEAHAARALVDRLEGLVAYEKNQENITRQSHQHALREEASRREVSTYYADTNIIQHQVAHKRTTICSMRDNHMDRDSSALNKELMDLSREVEVVKQLAAAAKNDGKMAVDQLAARLDAAETSRDKQQQLSQGRDGVAGDLALRGELEELQGLVRLSIALHKRPLWRRPQHQYYCLAMNSEMPIE